MDKTSDSCYKRKGHSTSYFPSERPYGEASILLLRHGLNFYTLFWMNMSMTSDLNQRAGRWMDVIWRSEGGWSGRSEYSEWLRN